MEVILESPVPNKPAIWGLTNQF